MPVILHSTDHSFSVIGQTESRDCFSKERPESSGLALIAGSPTGTAAGITGLMSTMPSLPLLSAGAREKVLVTSTPPAKTLAPVHWYKKKPGPDSTSRPHVYISQR